MAGERRIKDSFRFSVFSCRCRLCVVEIGPPGRTRLVNSCTYPVEAGLMVQTQSERVPASRRMVLELLLAQASSGRLSSRPDILTIQRK